jgi:hypothetical protein
LSRYPPAVPKGKGDKGKSGTKWHLEWGCVLQKNIKMNDIHKNIISFLFAIILFPFIGIVEERLLSFFKIIDDYGYVGHSFFNRFYNLFFNRYGIYDEPNLLFYLLNFVIAYLIIKKIITFILNFKPTNTNY